MVYKNFDKKEKNKIICQKVLDILFSKCYNTQAPKKGLAQARPKRKVPRPLEN
jgi:hypothetical protein